MNTKAKSEIGSHLKPKEFDVFSVLALLLLFPVAAQAGGVVTNFTEANLREAMSGGGLVTFACDGTIALTSTISNVVDTTLDGTGHQVTISGNNAVRIFYVATNIQFTTANLTLANGFASAGAAVLNHGGRVALTGVTLRANIANDVVYDDGLTPRGTGGAICSLDGVVAATNCWFTSNSAWSSNPSGGEARGGAFRNEGGKVELERCSFVRNQAVGGSAFSPQTTATGAAGGAIYNSSSFVADFCTFSSNSATAGAGYNGYGTSGGTASGGVAWNSGLMTITRSTFASNSVTGGSGGQGYNGAAVMEQGLPGQNGGSGGSGLGGVLLNSGTASLVNCTIAGNTGQGGNGGRGGNGGGGYVHYGGNGGNGGNAGSGEGAVSGPWNPTNCTVAWNKGVGGSGGAGGDGGTGVYPGSPGSPGGGGSAWGATAGPSSADTLLAGNSPGGNDTFPNPILGPLAANGGPTLTIALLPGSPAIDAGITALGPATDQRGYPRPVGAAADIGAFEYGSMLPLLSISRTSATTVTILATSNAGTDCRLLASTNLIDWQCIATNQFGTDGKVAFSENCIGPKRQFYRVSLP